jgi:hypothetical protein
MEVIVTAVIVSWRYSSARRNEGCFGDLSVDVVS